MDKILFVLVWDSNASNTAQDLATLYKSNLASYGLKGYTVFMYNITKQTITLIERIEP